jgi:hypothetical protein
MNKPIHSDPAGYAAGVAGIWSGNWWSFSTSP